MQMIPSRWQRRLSICCALLLGIGVALTAHDLALLRSWYLSAGLAAIAAVAFMLIAQRQHAKLDAKAQQLIFAHAGQVWIGKNAAPALDMPLPELSQLQRYLGLIWLRNSAGAQALIWPDSISREEHRQLRVWLGIHARQKS